MDSKSDIESAREKLMKSFFKEPGESSLFVWNVDNKPLEQFRQPND